MILDFNDETGYLLPGCYKCSIDEFKQRFVDDFPESKSRESRFKGFVEYSRYICRNVKSTRKQLIDGSFTTKKIDPNDIDFVIIINSCEMTEEEYSFIENECIQEDLRKDIYRALKKYVEAGTMDINELYCCDSYIIVRREPNEGKLYDEWLEEKAYWLNQWGHSRPDKETFISHPKGIIELKMDANVFEGI